MPLQQTTGNVTTDAYGGGVAAVPNYIEDVFSTYLYTGNGSSQTITNGIDLSTKGGLVWYKDRTTAYEHEWVDTARGAGYNLESPNTTASTSRPTALTAFNTTGFTLGSNAAANGSGDNFVSWTFRKQPKFFDVVTYTGNGNPSNEIAHSLGSTPGCVIIKNASATSKWVVAITNGVVYVQMYLNTTDSIGSADIAANGNGYVYTADATTFNVFQSANGNLSDVNTSGQTYVAYLYASNAGGFGLTGTDNVISCGTATGGTAVTLGYEPQWVMIKKTATTSPWYIVDNMRGWTAPTGVDQLLAANSSAAEFSSTNYANPTATGFIVNAHSDAFAYIAIRRGPMKVPTSGTSVFIPVTQTDGGTVTTNFPVDLTINGDRPSSWVPNWFDRLRGGSSNTYAILNSSSTNAEAAGSGTGSIGFQSNTGYRDYWNNNGLSAIYWNFRRAPSFFDEVCYTGTGADNLLTHNLGTKPLLVIGKSRSVGGVRRGWPTATDPSVSSNAVLFLELTNANAGGSTSGMFTSTTVNVGNSTGLASIYGEDWINKSGTTYVLYMFATCDGVSKVGSYTGTGSTQTISCGFTGGARFVLIKRTDSTGDWYVWDTARGMISGTDPSLLLNSTAAEVNANSVYTTTGGFQIVSTAAGINASGGSYIFLAIS